MSEDVSWRKYTGRFRTFPKLIHSAFDPDVRMIICIPACGEPDILPVLDSISRSHNNEIKTEVILLFNKNSLMSEAEIDQHFHSWEQCNTWNEQQKPGSITFFPVFLDELPDSKGGVGWARKMAMDEAARRLDGDGIIVCLDADCTVAQNYEEAVFQHFLEFKSHDAASIFYEHKIDHLDSLHQNAIIVYELHLRYLINAQRWCGHPYAYSTIGSAMAVRRKAYLEQGGMNTRRAGEDFYFLQKFIEIGAHGEIRNTVVYPSARISSRVPFGTGRAMHQILAEEETWMTTDFQIFRQIKPLFQSLDKLREISLRNPKEYTYQAFQMELGLSPDVVSYLKEIDFLVECHSIANQTASHTAFRRRFFRYFNSFRMIKYMHYMGDHYFPDVPVLEAVSRLAKEMKLPVLSPANEGAYLQVFREYDRGKR